MSECHKRNDAGTLLHPAFLCFLVRSDIDGLGMAGNFHRPTAILHARVWFPEGLLGLLAVVIVKATLVRHLHVAPGIFRQHEFVIDDIVETEHVGGDSIEFIVVSDSASPKGMARRI